MANSLPLPTADQRRISAEQFQRANQWLIAHRPERAVALLLNCCLVDPGNLIYRQALRNAQRQQPEQTGIVAALKKWFAARRLRHAMRVQDWTNVLLFAEDALTLNPNDSDSHLALASAFEAMGLLEHAVWSLEQGFDGGTNSAIGRELARLYERTARFTQASALAVSESTPASASELEVRALKDQIASSPEDMQLYLQLVRLYRCSGDIEAARDWLIRGLAARPHDFDLNIEQADLNLDSLRHDLAVGEARLSSEADNGELQANVARLRHDLQAREIELLRLRAERFPSDQNGMMELGTQLLRAGQFDAALEVFQKVRESADLRWKALVYSGYCYLNKKQWRRAEPLFKEALPLIPAEAEATRREVQRLLQEGGKIPGEGL